MPRLILIATVVAAWVWIVWRAVTQSITIDEATTYLVFASRDFPGVFVPANNNHLLNTLVMWVATHALGTSHLTVRLGALIGATIYLGSVVVVVRRIGGGLLVEWPLLACLVFNPVMGDFLVAARGYGLAVGFLMAGIAAAGIDRVRLRCAVCSLCAGLCFVSSFAFAFAAAAMLVVLFFWRLERRVLWSVLPGLAVTLLVAGWTLAHWPAGELWFGSHSLDEMTTSLTLPSLTRPDPQVIGAAAFRAFEAVKPWLIVLSGVIILLFLPTLDILGRVYGAILALTLAAHLGSFWIFGLLLPKERTGLFLIPLLTLVVGGGSKGGPAPLVGTSLSVRRVIPAVPADHLFPGVALECRGGGGLDGVAPAGAEGMRPRNRGRVAIRFRVRLLSDDARRRG